MHITAGSHAQPDAALPLRHAAPGLRQSYTDEFTGATYTLNTQKLAFDDAEDICNDIGGHVVSYGSISEQVAVELFYSNKASGAGAVFGVWLQC
jgi:hypothetical protein